MMMDDPPPLSPPPKPRRGQRGSMRLVVNPDDPGHFTLASDVSETAVAAAVVATTPKTVTNSAAHAAAASGPTETSLVEHEAQAVSASDSLEPAAEIPLTPSSAGQLPPLPADTVPPKKPVRSRLQRFGNGSSSNIASAGANGGIHEPAAESPLPMLVVSTNAVDDVPAQAASPLTSIEPVLLLPDELEATATGFAEENPFTSETAPPRPVRPPRHSSPFVEDDEVLPPLPQKDEPVNNFVEDSPASSRALPTPPTGAIARRPLPVPKLEHEHQTEVVQPENVFLDSPSSQNQHASQQRHSTGADELHVHGNKLGVLDMASPLDSPDNTVVPQRTKSITVGSNNEGGTGGTESRALPPTPTPSILATRTSSSGSNTSILVASTKTSRGASFTTPLNDQPSGSSTPSASSSAITVIGETFGSVLNFSRRLTLRLGSQKTTPAPRISVINAAPMSAASPPSAVTSTPADAPTTDPRRLSITGSPEVSVNSLSTPAARPVSMVANHALLDAPPSPSTPTSISMDDNPFHDNVTSSSEPLVSTPVVDINAWRNKRTNVVQEIVDTERAYGDDLEVLRDAYYEPCCNSTDLTKHEISTMFSNLLDLLHLSRELLIMLEDESKKPLEEQEIGQVFIHMGDRMARAYSIYCKNQDNASKLLTELLQRPEIADLFDACQQAASTRSNAWDLGAFIIKPVQRLLKYPLLLKDLRAKGTPIDHPDSPGLDDALIRVSDMANVINESKRRKDIVVKAVTDQFQIQEQMSKLFRGETTSKKYARVAQMLGQVTGLKSSTIDPTFDELNQRLDESEKALKSIIREVKTFVQNLRDVFSHQVELASVLEDVYFTFGSSHRHIDPVVNYKQTARGLLNVTIVMLADQMDTFVLKPLQELLVCYAGPTTVVKKRQRKRLDYDRCRDMETRSEKPEKLLKESSDAYLAINQQLVEELPRFMTLASLTLDLVTSQLACIVSTHLSDVHQQLSVFCKAFYSDEWIQDALTKDIAEAYITRVMPTLAPFADLVLCSNWNKARVMLLSGTENSAALLQPSRKTSAAPTPIGRGSSRQSTGSISPDLFQMTSSSSFMLSAEGTTEAPTNTGTSKELIQASVHASRVGTIFDVHADYDAQSLEELSVQDGDRIVALLPTEMTELRDDPEWYFVKVVIGANTGHQGYLPAAILTEVESL